MARQTRIVLKTYFEKSDKPTQAQFEALIDSLFPEQEQDSAASDLQVEDVETDLGVSITIPFDGVARLETSMGLNFSTIGPCLVEIYFEKNAVKIDASSRYISNASPSTLGNDYRIAAWAHLEDVVDGDVITLKAIALVGDVLCSIANRAIIVTTTPE